MQLAVVYVRTERGDLVVYELHQRLKANVQLAAVTKGKPHGRRQVLRVTRSRLH